jgi:aubergine-like protein
VDRTEIVKKFVCDAITMYRANNGALPQQIVIYRDGMGGPTLTKCVQEYEVKAITELLENTTPGYKPKIMYCLVDRNIQHRLFASSGQEKLNPGPGTIVDTSLVEQQGDNIFDFYLIPHKATVATAQPVLYRSVYNTTSMTKDQFETSTYHLCYNYFNFAGPIKVPMVCMYAHKIAAYAQENKNLPNENLATFLHFL